MEVHLQFKNIILQQLRDVNLKTTLLIITHLFYLQNCCMEIITIGRQIEKVENLI